MSDPLDPPPPSSSLGQVPALTRQALQLRSQDRYARHPIENTLLALRHLTGDSGEEGYDSLGFQSAEGIYRAGAQGLRVSENPQLPQSLVQLPRLRVLDKAGRKSLRLWVEAQSQPYDEPGFLQHWKAQGEFGGAEHHVYYDETSGRWFKRLHAGINESSLGDYFDRMRLHAVLFPETAYRLEGFTINAKSKELAPVVSQPHIDVALDQPPVSKAETDALMAGMGFVSVQLKYNDVVDDGYHAYYHAPTGVLVHDLHDQNVVRMNQTHELAVIDPYISHARRGTWAALKLAEVGIAFPSDDPIS